MTLEIIVIVGAMILGGVAGLRACLLIVRVIHEQNGHAWLLGCPCGHMNHTGPCPSCPCVSPR